MNRKQIIKQECQKKSKIILNELINRYDIKYKQLELQLLNANEEIIRLKINRNVHDETLKKAVIRS
ncbi:unnamed protein product, partial [Rotaria sp. Silwood2]